jgi:hypothetical protein
VRKDYQSRARNYNHRFEVVRGQELLRTKSRAGFGLRIGPSVLEFEPIALACPRTPCPLG